MRQLVHDGHDGAAREHRVGVHLGERRTPVGHLAAGQLLQPVEHHLRARPVVVLHEADDDIGAPFDTAVRLGQDGIGLADTGCRPEIDAQLSAPRLRSC